MHLYSTPPGAVHCPRCLKWWKPGNVSCTVVHMGDGCCHYGDTEVTAAGSPQPPLSPQISVVSPSANTWSVSSDEMTRTIANRIGSISNTLTA